jgi:hypothetical protein
MACGSGQPGTPSAIPPSSTPTPTATATSTPTSTPVPLNQQVSVASVHAEESGESPNYKITSETPVILENDDPRVQAFNSLASALVQRDINEFKAALKYLPGTPVSSGSYLDIAWQLVSPPGEILSLRFGADGYADGAAHPYHYTQTLSFNIEQGEEVSLGSLFLPGSDYLAVIAEYCKTQLASRDIGFDMSSEGADPTEENYRSWNITGDGLLITFDEYQVAPYAAGPQTVVIPYSSLRDIIDPQGPLGKYLQ